MIRSITLLAVVSVAALLLHAAAQPETFLVQRTASIDAPPAAIHSMIDDLRRFNVWNPYEKKDPDLKGTYLGPQRGPGAAYAFEGNRDVGKGSIRIVSSSPPTGITMRLDMLEPFEGHNTVEFTLVPRGGGATEVTWAMYGPSPFIARLIGLFVDMDAMIGRDFEAGLAELKQVAERSYATETERGGGVARSDRSSTGQAS